MKKSMNKATAVMAADVSTRTKPSNYPEPFASLMAGRRKQALGDKFGLTHFGVNRTILDPGAISALRHWHSVQDEFIYILSGYPTLVTEEGEMDLCPGMCMGFQGGEPNGRHLINRSTREVVYLEVGDRLPGDSGSYPDDDLKAVKDSNGQWQFLHKDGVPY